MGFLSDKVLQSDCSGNSKAGVQLWSEPTESAKVLGKDYFPVLGVANVSIASGDEEWGLQNWFAAKVFPEPRMDAFICNGASPSVLWNFTFIKHISHMRLHSSALALKMTVG